MPVPFLDLGAAYVEVGGEIDAAVERVLASGRYVFGPRSLPVADGLQHEVLSLPIGPHLPDDQIDYVVDRVRAFDG